MQQQKTILLLDQRPKTTQKKKHIHYTHTIFVQLLRKVEQNFMLASYNFLSYKNILYVIGNKNNRKV